MQHYVSRLAIVQQDGSEIPLADISTARLTILVRQELRKVSGVATFRVRPAQFPSGPFQDDLHLRGYGDADDAPIFCAVWDARFDWLTLEFRRIASCEHKSQLMPPGV